MYSLYRAYQTYERRVWRGELNANKVTASGALRHAARPSFAYRLGDALVRTGTKLKQQALTGHALTSTTMAAK